MMPHNMTMTVAGAGMLWVGWFGFNGGSALAANGDAAMAMLVTHLSAAAGAMTWMGYEWIKFGKPTALGTVTGMVAGLGTITPASGFVGPAGAHEAAKTGRIDKVRRLLAEGHPVNAVDPSFGLTPLHFAVRNGWVEVARLLIANGADLTQPSAAGITPLDWTSTYLDPDQRAELLRAADSGKETDGV